MLTAVLMAAITVVMMPVVIAVGVRIILQISFGKRLRCFVSRTLDASIKFDSGIGECHLRTHTDPAANKSIRLCRLQEAGKRAVSASIGVYDLLIYDLTILNIVQLELLRVAEVLEDFSVLIGYCDPHVVLSLLVVYSSSGFCPSWAFHAHSVIFISVNTAVKLESSGLHA